MTSQHPIRVNGGKNFQNVLENDYREDKEIWLGYLNKQGDKNINDK